MKFSIKDFFSKCDQIRRKLRIWLHLLKKSLMENFFFCAVNVHIMFILYLLSRSKGQSCFMQFAKECNYFRVTCLFLAVYNKQDKVPLTRVNHLVFFIFLFTYLIPCNVFRFMLFFIPARFC